jgi:hypothetical protein
VGIVGGDVVTISNTGTFASVTVGTGIVVTSTQTISGADASKYILTVPTGLTADITAKALTVSGASVTSKVYNGLNPATITGASLVGIVSPDVVTVSGNGVFVSTAVANGISVTPSLSLGGADAGNYTITQPTLTGNITPAPLTITGLTGDNRVYNGTNGATLSGTAAYIGLQNGETFSVTGTPTATFANKTVGTAKAITVTGYTAPNSNYTVTQPTGLTANITVAPLTITSATATNRVYNATTTVTVGGTLSGIFLSDVVTLNTTGTTADANVGTGKTVTFSIAGADAANYSLTQPGTTVDITQASQTIIFGTLPAKTTADVPFSAGATSATSGVNALGYISSTPTVATINATTGLITIVGAGTTTITVSQTGNSNYTAATSVQQALTVTLAPVSIFTNPITGTNPNTSNPYTTGQTVNSNITVTTGIGRGIGIAGSNANNRYNADGWTTAASVDLNDYIEFGLTPNLGCFIDFSELLYTSQASGNGPTVFAVRSSVDGFTSNIATPTSSGGTVSLTAASFDNIASAITYRIYGYSAVLTTGTFSVNDFDFKGNVICIQTIAYNVTGGGTTCTGSGLAVGLSNSQVGVSYQLKNGVTNVGSTVPGTGAAISFGSQTAAGTYTVVGSNTNGTCNLTLTMSGSATITVNPLPTATVTGTTSVCTNGTQPSITFIGDSGTAPYTFSYKINGGAIQTVTSASGTNPVSVTVAVPTTTPGTFAYNLTSVSGQFCTQAQTGTATVTVGAISTYSAITGWDVLPTEGRAIVFDADYALAGNLSGCSCTVNAGKVVTISSLSSMTLLNGITVDPTATMTFQNNAPLVQINDVANSGNVEVFRNSSLLMRLDYTSWSSPVIGTQTLKEFSPLTVNTRFYRYNEQNNYYSAVDPLTTTFSNLGVGKGFLIRMPDTHPTTATLWTSGKFVGTPANGTIPVAITTDGSGFNMIGNPYPSQVDITQFLTDNSANIESTLYFWRKTNEAVPGTVLFSGYCTYTGNVLVLPSNPFVGGSDPLGVLQIAQGFMVKAKPSRTSVVFNNAMRINNTANQFFKQAATEAKNTLWLNLMTSAGGFAQMATSYRDNATMGVDVNDGLNINDGQISIGSFVDNKNYVIQSRTLPFDTADVMPLIFKVNIDGNYTLAIDHVDGLFSNGAQPIYIHDKVLNTVTNLSTGNYTFATTAGTFNNRFEIVYQPTLSNPTTAFNENSVVVYKNNGDIVVNTGNVLMKAVQIYDMRGRLLLDKTNINAAEVSLNIGAANQVVLVKNTLDEGQVVTKKVIN